MERITLTRPSTFNGKIARHDDPPPPPLSSAIVAYTDVSFSTYLNPDKSNTSTRPDYGNSNTDHVALDDNELSVFDAQKYFNEGNEQQQQPSSNDAQYDPSRFSSVTSSSIDGYGARNYRGRSFHATPTACSEASWNSQTGLLSNPPNSIKVSLRNVHITSHTDPVRRRPKSGGGGAKWLFRRRCPCIGKKSLQVEDNIIVDPKSPVHFSKVQSPHNDHRFPQDDKKVHFQGKSSDNTSSQTVQNHSHVIQFSQVRAHDECATTAFSFPILKPSSKIILKNSFPTPPPNAKTLTHEDEEPPRESLDVFRLPDYSKSRDLHVASSKEVDDDLASDGSSDLFEIESFSTQTTSYPGYDGRLSLDEASNFQNPPRRLAPLGLGVSGRGLYEERNSVDEPVTPSVAPSEIYEPSEVSVDWSVTTAEGFDRASVATYDERSEVENSGGKKKGGTGLLGCRCEKAVSVGPTPCKMGPQVIPPSMMSRNVIGRAHATLACEHRSSNSENRNRNHVPAVNFNNKPPMGHQHCHPAARVSLAFAA